MSYDCAAQWRVWSSLFVVHPIAPTGRSPPSRQCRSQGNLLTCSTEHQCTREIQDMDVAFQSQAQVMAYGVIQSTLVQHRACGNIQNTTIHWPYTVKQCATV